MVKLIVPYVTFCHFLYHMLTYGTKKSCIWSVLVPSVVRWKDDEGRGGEYTSVIFFVCLMVEAARKCKKLKGR